MTKETLKDKLDGNELDLSLSNLTKVPVKELAALPKATSLDLSCNQLTILPDSFSSLIHIVKIDLSKNSLTELPSNFGSLERLQRLDLLGNRLQTLPVSFARLNNLRWLDLKENPLAPTLNKVVGDCLDDKQCKLCAQRVIKYMRAVQEEHDRIQDTLRQQKMEEERLQEAARQEEEAKQKQIKKKQKQLEKERRKKEYEAAQKAKRLQEQKDKPDEEETEETEVRPNGLKNTHAKKSSGFSCFAILISLLVVLVAVCVGVYFFCESDKTNDLCVDIHYGLDQVRERVQNQIKQWQK